MTFECSREPDVLDALTAQRWPRRAEDELRTHVASCAICTDLVAVASRLIEEQDAASAEVRVPPAGVVWWRAQIRARQEAARAASRPITIAQTAAVVSVLSVAIALVVTGWASLDGWGTALSSMTAGLRGIARPGFPLPALTGQGLYLAVAIGISLVIAPLAIYLAVSDE